MAAINKDISLKMHWIKLKILFLRQRHHKLVLNPTILEELKQDSHRSEHFVLLRHIQYRE